MIKLLHFADAHIDMVSHGRRDPQSGLPLRVLDFLKALDTIVDTAIDEKVDVVIFAGDAYRDRTPAPTYQREWGKRIMRLSQAGIPTVLLVGNHDLSPAVGRASALQEYDTLQVPHVHLIHQPTLLRPDDLEGLPLQILATPWIARSRIMAQFEMSAAQPDQIFEHIEDNLGRLINTWLENEVDASLPTVLAAHASVQGAVYGGERSVMLGGDLVLPLGLVRDPRLDYVALGHIHKPQNLNEGQHPPVIYPGSIERVDFGEAADDKFFVIARVERGKTEVEWRKLNGRQFIDRYVTLTTAEEVTAQLKGALPAQDALTDAVVRLTVEYPREWEPYLDEAALRNYAAEAFEFHFIRRPKADARVRLAGDQSYSSMQSLDLLDVYWKSVKTRPEEGEALQKLAGEIIQRVDGRGEGSGE